MRNIYNQMNERTGWNLPKWLIFFVFLKRGLYLGKGWKINLKRIMCWFNRHYFHEVDFPTNIRLDCTDCGEQIKIEKGKDLSDLVDKGTI